MWSGCPKTRIRLPTEIGGAGSSKQKHREYGCLLRRVRCQADGLAYASTLELPGMAGVRSMRSMNLPTSVAERVKVATFQQYLSLSLQFSGVSIATAHKESFWLAKKTTFTDANYGTTATLNAISSPLAAGQCYLFSGQVSATPAVPNGAPVNFQRRSGSCTGSFTLTHYPPR
jgi:hypothetical protein